MQFPGVCLSGSMRFYPEMIELAQKLTHQGQRVLLPFTSFQEKEILSPEHVQMLAEMHDKKIAMSQLLCVVCPGGYIGQATRHEIEHARKCNVPVPYVYEGSHE
jgi:hypothetical protein